MNNRKLLQLKVDTLTDPEVAEVPEDLEIMESLSTALIRLSPVDELILKDWYDNKRSVRQGAANSQRAARKRSCDLI